MKKKLFLIPLAMFMTAGAIGMAGCGDKKDPDPTPQTQTLDSIDVTKQPTKLVYQVGETFDPAGLEVKAKYSDGTTKVLNGTEYTIDPLTPLTADSKVVTIAYEEGGITRYAEIDISVISGQIVPVTAIKYTLTPSKYTIEIGETINIKIDVEPADATVKTVTYEFSNDGIVSIENGIITGLAEGTTDIIIKSTSNPEISKKISGFKVKKADAAAPAATAAGFEKFTEGALKNGETINIAAVYGDKIFGMGALAGTFIEPTELSVDGDGKLVVGEALNYKALLNNDGTYSLKDSNGKYLSLAASGNNIAIKEVADDDCKFVIGHGENGTTTIVGANTSKDSRFLVYNANNPRFSFYKESTASGYPQLIVYHDGKEAEQKAVTGVAFKAESYTVEAGFTVSVAAGVLPEDATDQEITYSLENVSPAGCATISGNVITGVEAGSADVVATSHDGGFTATVKLTVIPEQVPQHEGTEADPLTGADAMLIARKLEHKQVTESTYYIKDTVTKTESFDPTYGNYSFWFGDFECYRMWKNSINNKFTSADEIEVGDVVTVVAKITRYNQTLETAEKTGYTVNIEKPAIPATGVTLDKTELSMEVGSAPQQLVATVAPEGAAQEVNWESDDPLVATVENGVINAVSVGEATITAKVASDPTLHAECVVTVSAATRTMTGITATGLVKTAYETGDKLDLTGLVVQAVYDVGDPETITAGYTTNIALDHELELTDTSLVVSYGDFDAAPIALTVTQKVIHVTGVNVEGYATKTVEVGKTFQLVASVNPADADDKLLTYTADESGHVTVDETGLVTGVSEGTAVVTVASHEDPSKKKDITFSVVDPMPAQTSTGFVQLSNAEDLVNGKLVQFYGKDLAKGINGMGYGTGNNQPGKTATVSEEKIVPGADTATYKLIKNADDTFSFLTPDNKYLAATGGTSNNYLKTAAEINDKAKFSITLTNGAVVIKCIDEGTTRNTISYNASQTNNLFSCYTEENAKSNPAIYMYIKDVMVETVNLSAVSSSFVVGNALTVEAEVLPADAVDKSLVWSVENADPADCIAVSNAGVVTATAAGTATIKATAVNGVYGEYTVTATSSAIAVTGVELNKETLTMVETDTETLTATVSPDGATDDSVSWTVEDASPAGCVTVSDAGLVTAVAPGTATVKVTTNDGGFTDTCAVTVSQKKINVDEVDKFDVNATTIELQSGYGTGSSEYFAWTDLNKNGDGQIQGNNSSSYKSELHNTYAFSKEIKYVKYTVGKASGNDAQIEFRFGDTVSPEGNAVIVGKDNAKCLLNAVGTYIFVPTAGCTYFSMKNLAYATYLSNIEIGFVEYVAPGVEDVSLDKTTLAMEVDGDDVQLTATYTPGDAEPKSVAWSSNDETVATVADGLVHAVGVGTATVTVTADGKTATCTVTVTEKETGTRLVLDGSKLTGTATTSESELKYGDTTYVFSSGAKYQSSSGDNKFADKAIMIGKSGAYIYNKDAIPGVITKFEVYVNKGASSKVTFGVMFSDTAITAYSEGANTATLGDGSTLGLDTVYDLSDKLTDNCQYFWFQITNANNAQVEFRITYTPAEA